MKVETTSVTLLKDIATDARSVRWKEFVDRYCPLMMGYLRARYVGIEYEDVVQETFAALARLLPDYCYAPEEKGSFHDYLTAVLRHKACDAIRKTQRREAKERNAVEDPTFGMRNEESADGGVRKAAFRIALREVLNDKTILARNRRVFVEVAVNGRCPDEVSRMFGISRNNVDQIKARIVKALKIRTNELLRMTDV